MKRPSLLILILAATFLIGCHHDREPNKIIDGLPLKVEESIIPAYALQELYLLSLDNVRVAITVVNKTSLASTSYSELTNISSNTYQYHLTNAHYGNATVTIQFYDVSGAAIDPISTHSSTAALKTVAINSIGTSALFNYTQRSALTFDRGGDILSTIHSTGTYTFNGSGYSINFFMPIPGARTVLDGFQDGALGANGTGPGGPVYMALGMGTEQSVNGILNWDGQEGSVRIGNSGVGFVATGQARTPLQ